jgi:hypothetical protein
MRQRTKNYLLATIVAAIIGTGLTVSCASQKLSVTQNNAEIVPSVNAKPEVVWSEGNPPIFNNTSKKNQKN